MRRFLSIMTLVLAAACSGGYSFTGADVGNAKTVSIEYFPNYANLINPQLSQIFTENLRDIFVRQTPLNLKEEGGDLQFSGSITDYSLTPINAQASQPGELGGEVAQTRLTIQVNVSYINTLDEKQSFEQRFSRFADFDSNVELAQVEEELMDQITTQLAENILNQAIGNW